MTGGCITHSGGVGSNKMEQGGRWKAGPIEGRKPYLLKNNGPVSRRIESC